VATKFTISTVFNAIDHMTGPIEKMNAKVGKLGDKIDNAGKAASSRFGNLGGIAKGVGVAMGTAAVAAGAAVWKLATHAQEAADSVMDTAGALGISTRALQEYRYVAQLSGMETADMDAALTKLTVNLGKGGKEMDATLAMLGLTAEQLRAAGPDQVLELVAEGFKNVSDPAAKAAITTQLFGKSSVRMVGALSGGAEAIAKLREEAQKSGYVMDETALATGARMGDAIDRMKFAAEGAANKLGIMFIPVMEKMITSATGFLQKAGPGLAGTLGGLGDIVSTTFDALMPVLNSVFGILGPVLGLVASVMGGLAPLFAMIGTLLGKIMPLVGGLAELVGAVLAPAFELLMPVLEPVFDILGLVFEIVSPIFKVLTAVVRGAVKVFKDLPWPIKAVIGVIFPFIGIPMLIKAAWEPIKKFFGPIWDTIKAGVEVAWTAIEAFLTGLWDNITKTATEVWNAIPELAQSAAAAFMSAWQAVGDFFTGLWGGIVKAFDDAVAWILQAIQPILDVINTVGNGLQAIGIGGPVLTPAVAGAGPTNAPASSTIGGAMPAWMKPSVPISSQTTTINRNTTTTGTLNVNFPNAPAGTSVKQTGQAPGIKVNMGKTTGGSR
jgi:phage-related protein